MLGRCDSCVQISADVALLAAFERVAIRLLAAEDQERGNRSEQRNAERHENERGEDFRGVHGSILQTPPVELNRPALAGVPFEETIVQAGAMTNERETGLTLDPKWDDSGLITGVVTDATTGDLLMVAHLNAEALDLTRTTGEAHFWSRSRGRLWKKGETSGNILRVVELRIDCDQDALWIRAEAAGPVCHTGRQGCFYRKIDDESLTFT